MGAFHQLHSFRKLDQLVFGIDEVVFSREALQDVVEGLFLEADAEVIAGL
ncbi:hypothetical protein Pan14r_11480 [Crateriforma conspicua]|uniref:Uncharacterized protein n=1 Tax=Crateriforma conspicua TaxID=2527996 RepID=A0A5C5Y3M2_9PLAN|nr:hypothetical protein Pan14r_11480 [Crateriforma conspicua]